MGRLAPDDTVDGKYRILRRLRSGGMGELYLVRHLHLQEQRVIKVLRTDLARHEEAAVRFRREAQLATHVKHPRVATLHDFSALPDGSFYMVWEYIEGQDVGSWLREKGVFPVAIAVELAIQALAGLEAIHRAQIVHRDISPDNLMITVDDRGRLGIKVIDLGLAKNLGDGGLFDSQEGSFGGKLNYCSPEHVGLFQDIRPDRLSDLYCFAIVLYQMISGELPFERLGPGTGLVDRFHATPPLLNQRNPQVRAPEQLEAIIARALSFERADRYPAASTFREALQDVLAQLRIEPRVPTPPPVEDSAGIVLDDLAEEDEPEPSMEQQILRFQILQTRELVEQYLATGQEALARFSLASLIELDPEHPEAEELEQRIVAGAERRAESATMKRLSSDVLAAAEAGDSTTTERLLEQLAARSPEEAVKLRRRVALVAESQQLDRKITDQRRRLDQLIAAGRLEEAESELRLLATLEVPKVVLDLYRSRLAAVRDTAAEGERVGAARSEFENLVTARRWQDARELARSLEQRLGAEAAGAMLREVGDREAADRRAQATEDAASAVATLLDAGQVEQASIALRVLRRLDPDSPLPAQLEGRLRELEGRARRKP